MSRVGDYSRISPGFEIDAMEGRAFAYEAIELMRPHGARISPPDANLVASAGRSADSASDTTSDAVQTFPVPSLQRAGGRGVRLEGGFVGSVQLCYDACTSEFSVVGWIWAGAGVVTPGIRGDAWWGAFVFGEQEFFRTRLDFMPRVRCGTCDAECRADEHHSSLGLGIAGFPVVIKPGERASLGQAGIEVGVLLTPRSFCDGNIEIIALIDLTRYLGPMGAAVASAQQAINRLAERYGIELDCGIGVDISGDVHLCRSVPGGGIFGVTSDSARICGGGFVACAIGLSHNRSELPRG